MREVILNVRDVVISGKVHMSNKKIYPKMSEEELIKKLKYAQKKLRHINAQISFNLRYYKFNPMSHLNYEKEALQNSINNIKYILNQKKKGVEKPKFPSPEVPKF